MSILEKLSDSRIVNFDLCDFGTKMIVSECCDYYYDARLSKKQVKQLIDELSDLYSKMNNAKINSESPND